MSRDPMYKKRGVDLNIQEVLDKMQGKRPSYTPIVYPSSDIEAAKTVLDRLLTLTARSHRASRSSTEVAVREIYGV